MSPPRLKTLKKEEDWGRKKALQPIERTLYEIRGGKSNLAYVQCCTGFFPISLLWLKIPPRITGN